MAQSILGMFDDIFKQMNITKHDLEKAEDEIDLPEMTALEFSQIEDKGIDMIANASAIEISAGKGIFTYKKRPVVVYIKDQYLDNTAIQNKKYTKYHLCYCKALKQAAKEHRFYNRYVMARRTTGDFWIRIYKKKSEILAEDYAYRKLNICQDCLRQMNWKNFNSYCGPNPDYWWESGDSRARNKIVNKFSIDEFLKVMRKEIRAEMAKELKHTYLSDVK